MKRAALLTAGGIGLLLSLAGCGAAHQVAPVAPSADEAVVFSSAVRASALRHSLPTAQEQAVTGPDFDSSGSLPGARPRAEAAHPARTMAHVDSQEPSVVDVALTKAAAEDGPTHGLTTPAPPAGPSGPDRTQAAAYESSMLAQLNARRARDGVPALRLSACARSYAGSWSPVIARNGELSHRKLVPVLTRCHVRIVGENVGWNTSQSSADMVDAFMASPGHAANIMDRRYSVVGIGAFHDARGRWWVTQDFLG